MEIFFKFLKTKTSYLQVSQQDCLTVSSLAVVFLVESFNSIKNVSMYNV